MEAQFKSEDGSYVTFGGQGVLEPHTRRRNCKHAGSRRNGVKMMGRRWLDPASTIWNFNSLKPRLRCGVRSDVAHARPP